MFHLNHNASEPECAAVEKAKADYRRAVSRLNVAHDYGVFDLGLIVDAANALGAIRRAELATVGTKSNRRPPSVRRAYPVV